MAKEETVLKTTEFEVTTKSFVHKLQAFADNMQIDFDDYQKECVVNAIRTIEPMIKAQGLSISSFDTNNVVLVLQQVAFLRLNPSANPRECYFIVRKNKDDRSGKPVPPTLEFGIEGAGNDVILQEFGRDVKEVKSKIVYEGDDFTAGYMDGWDEVLPKYNRNFKSNKPEKCFYLVKRNNGEIDVLYSTLDDVKKSLLAGAKQNGADDKLLREIEKEDVYTLLTDEKWINRKIVKEYTVTNQYTKKKETKSYESPLFNPSYTSPGSRDNMIERKLRNHAIRKYPKNFDRTEVKGLYEETFEEEKYTNRQVIDAEERVEIAQNEFDEQSGKVEVGSTTNETTTTPQTKTPKPKKEVGETLEVVETNPQTGEVIEEILPNQSDDEELVEDEEVIEIPDDDDLPDFMK